MACRHERVSWNLARQIFCVWCGKHLTLPASRVEGDTYLMGEIVVVFGPEPVSEFAGDTLSTRK